MGERFYIYAAKGRGTKARSHEGTKGVGVWSRDLAVSAGDGPPAWMLELAEQVKLIEPGALLPTGVIVGTAVIDRVTEIRDQKSEGRSQKSG